jgi:hypothetical protein
VRAFAIVILLAGPALAADPVAELKERIQALERTLAEVPSAVEALHDLENRVEALRHDLESAQGRRAADADVRRAIDELRGQVGELDRRLYGTQAQLDRPRSSVALGYHDGVNLDAGPVRITLGAGVQGRYSGMVLPAPTRDISSFDVHHAQLDLRGVMQDWLEVFMRFDFGFEYASAGGAAMVRDLYVEARPLSWLSIRGGQFKVPFSRQRQVNALRQTFVDRSLATRVFAPDRDIGALIEARLLGDKLLFQGAVTDGITAGEQLKNDNLDLAYTFRVVAQPLGAMPVIEGDRGRSRSPRIAFGAAVQYNLAPTDLPAPLDDVDHNGVIDSVEVISANAEFAFKWHGFAVEGEYFFRRERPGFGRATRQYHGGYGQASAMLWRGLELGVRYSRAQNHALRPVAVGIYGNAPVDAQEIGAVLNYYVWGERCKVQLEYDYRDEVPADPIDPRARHGHLLMVQAQAAF